jgi:uncharacterized DUF497 family protein
VVSLPRDPLPPPRFGRRFGYACPAQRHSPSLSLTIPDPDHSQVEERFIILGKSHTGKLLLVVHTDRGDSLCMISAWRASRWEGKNHKEGN